MDFVVLGFGIGALAVLVGLGIRDLGPMLRRVPRGERSDLPWSEVARRIGWGRACRAAGLVVTLSGAALCLLTLLVLIAGAGDGFGMGAVLGALAIALVVGGIWAALFVRPANPGRAGGGRLSGLEGDVRRRPIGARVATERRNTAPKAGATSRLGGGSAGRRRSGPPSGRIDPRSVVESPAPDKAEEARRRVERGK